MNRTLYRVVHSNPDPHLRLNVTPEPGKGRGRSVVFLGMALLAGMLAGLIFVTQPGLAPDLGALELLAETPTAAQVAEAATLTPTATLAPAGQAPAAATGAVVPFATGPVFPRPVDFSSVDLRTVVAPATATPTRTPLPPLESIRAVAGAGGAVLWDLSGLEVTRVPQGALLTLQARSSDNAWLFAVSGDGKSGWVAADQVLASDTGRLRAEEVVIIPITPTPAGAAARSTPTAGQTPAAPGVTSPTARVSVTDARLNIRSGPGPGYPVVAKADPGTLLPLLGRGPAGWLQVAAPEAPGGVGWVAVEFVETSVPVDSLPVVDSQPAVPAGGEVGTGTGKGGMAAEPAAEPGARAILQPTPVPAAVLVPTATSPRPVTGLQGKLLIQRSWGAQIYLYDLVTGELRLLTGGFDPAFSPDGKTVAFTRAGGQHGLYLIDADGQNERLIFSGRELLRSPKFSPDGRAIVFERGDEVIVCRESREGCLPNTPANDDLPRATERQEKLAVVDINGQNYRDLPVFDRAHAPDWNSAGIVYQSPAGIQLTQDAPGATTEKIFHNIQKQYEMDPDWQPGGGRIVFQRRETGHWRILSINPDGSDLVDLTRPTFTLVDELPTHVAPAWSYDGKHIVFLSNRMPDPTGQGYTAGRWHIWVMDADGGNARQLPIELEFNYTFVSEQMLDWGP